MARLFNTVAGLSLASVALTSPVTPHIHTREYNATSSCAQVGAAIAIQNVTTPVVPAQLAYDCLNSIPFNQSAAIALVDGVVPYFKWQSTTVFLKDPPKEYAEKIQSPYDVWGGLEKIRKKVTSGAYDNEYEVSYRSHYKAKAALANLCSSVSSSTAFFSKLTVRTLAYELLVGHALTSYTNV
jgi:hypothetical protein